MYFLFYVHVYFNENVKNNKKKISGKIIFIDMSILRYVSNVILANQMLHFFTFTFLRHCHFI